MSCFLLKSNTVKTYIQWYGLPLFHMILCIFQYRANGSVVLSVDAGERTVNCQCDNGYDVYVEAVTESAKRRRRAVDNNNNNYTGPTVADLVC